ncbi:1436_t:CDS:2 [Paraglomus occultum]|uniref:1436_t:CDS:1 n=1 Tax=Paraglomus occultum TaxID=144539 RepID=A0A9N8VNA5_9GLOM|nr:1436_t:CDS:2 [Paraglomus occultum]
MVQIEAQAFINANFDKKNAKTITNKELVNKLATTLASPGGLKGKLELKELTIINCPKLKKINVKENKLTKLDITKAKTVGNQDDGDPAPATNLNNLVITGNSDLEEFSVENCPDLKSVLAAGCPKLKKVPGLDKAKKLGNASFDGDIMSLIIREKLSNFENITRAVGDILGLGSDEDQILNAIGNLPSQDLKNRMVVVTTPQLQTAKENAEKERDAARAELESIKTERDQLKQQLAEVKNELNLEENTTQQQILDQIKELMKRPTSSCSHTDYDSIKSERDSLQSQVNNLQSENNQLKDENKENAGMTKEALFESTKNHFGKLGVKVLDDSKLQNAATAHNVENIRNEIISSEFNKLKDERNSAHYLNLGLGAIALGSLIFIA